MDHGAHVRIIAPGPRMGAGATGSFIQRGRGCEEFGGIGRCDVSIE